MADTSEIGGLLNEDHRRTISALNALEGRVAGQDRDVPIIRPGTADAQLIDTVTSVIDHDLCKHFLFEEDVLFPALRNRGMGDLATILVQEHDAIRPLAERLRTLAVRSTARQLDASSWKAVRHAAMDLIHSVLFHIQKEEMGVFKQLPILIKADTDRWLAERFRSFEKASV